jgi:hypothetical protein
MYVQQVFWVLGLIFQCGEKYTSIMDRVEVSKGVKNGGLFPCE